MQRGICRFRDLKLGLRVHGLGVGVGVCAVFSDLEGLEVRGAVRLGTWGVRIEAIGWRYPHLC